MTEDCLACDPGHLHYVIQPVTRQQMSAHGCHGPRLQVAMSGAGPAPRAGQIAAVVDRARQLFARTG